MTSMAEKWCKVKKSGHFKRQIKKNYLTIIKSKPIVVEQVVENNKEKEDAAYITTSSTMSGHDFTTPPR